MTNPKSDTPCPPECRTIEAAHYDSDHVPSCPNAFRPNAEAHKCDCGADDFNARNLSEGDRRVPHALNCPKRPNAEVPKVACEDSMCDLPKGHARPHRLRGDALTSTWNDEKPAPAPEPKRSAMKPRCAWEPGTPGECSAYLALRAEVEELKQENQDQAEELASSGRVRLRAELAAAKEEIGKLERDVEFLSSSLAAQRSKATLVESALAEANSHIAFVYRERDAERAAREKAEGLLPDLLSIIRQPSRHGLNWAAVEQAAAILAKKEESK